VLGASDDSGPALPSARFVQDLAAKTLETVRLTEALSTSPGDSHARGELARHLSDLQRAAGELGFVHLQDALVESLGRLERESFGPASLIDARVLAWRYESLASVPSQSGTHPVVGEERPPVGAYLGGRRVLVADADAEARWFYVGILRGVGARVIEARDGLQALELARAEAPDLILADVVMPRLDGLALCAAVRREPLLDGVPVALLSWQDEFHHRARELGADAQEYLRKEIPADEILERLSRLLGPLKALEEQLTSARATRGDLADLGVSALLRAARRLRPDASIVLQDPWSLFEIELRDGRIVGATRTGIDGARSHGAAVFPPLVGMSSGRFIVAEATEGRPAGASDSLEAAFEQATRRLSHLMSTLAAHPGCCVELDQEALGAYVRHSPVGIQRLVARLVAGEPIQALWESAPSARALVDALLITLARQGAIRNVTVVGSASSQRSAGQPLTGGQDEWNDPENEPDLRPVAESLQRENIRAQLAIAMHREPANAAPRSSYPIWRLHPGFGAGNPEDISGFEMQIKSTPRILGFGFAMLLSATVGFLVWRQLIPTPEAMAPTAVVDTPADGPVGGEPIARVANVVAAPQLPGGVDLSAFAGVLREGVDPSLAAGPGQGVLELYGSAGVTADVDGVDRGELPVTLVLDQGKHLVRFRVGSASSDRFYYVKSGATRAVTH